jgi:hypothetical protein
MPDLGSAIVFIGILFAMLFWSGVSPRLLLLLASPAVSLLLAADTRWWGAWMLLLFLLPRVPCVVEPGLPMREAFAKAPVQWYQKMLNMDFVLAIAEDQVPSTKEPDPYMHVFLDAGDGNVLAFFELPTASELPTTEVD